MATAKSKKTATKKVAKKTAAPKKVATKRAYKRKPKVAAPYTVEQIEKSMNAEDASPNRVPQTLSLFDVNLLDLRGMPVPVKAMFLLELESLGFRDSDLDLPSNGGWLDTHFLRNLEVISLNQVNRVVRQRTYASLKTEDGVITVPTAYNAGVVIFDAEKRLAAPDSLEVDGVKYAKVS